MPSSRVLTFTDPFQYQSAVRAAEVELYPTAKGQFRSELIQINLQKLWMQRFHEDLPQIYNSKIIPGRRVIAFLTTTDQPSIQYCGAEVTPHEIVLCSRDVIHQRTEGNCQFGAMSLADSDFASACNALIGDEISESPRKHVIRPSPDLMSRLVDLHNQIGNMAKIVPDVLALPEVARALEQRLIHLMVRTLAGGVSPQMANTFYRYNTIAARFEEYLEANTDRPLYLPEICAAIGAAERTLRTVCERHFGMGPIRYLSLRRMHLVRRSLLRANPSTATVTRLATDHGFWELGRFSVAYRDLFGEKPSETLGRPSDHRPIFSNRPSSLAS